MWPPVPHVRHGWAAEGQGCALGPRGGRLGSLVWLGGSGQGTLSSVDVAAAHGTKVGPHPGAGAGGGRRPRTRDPRPARKPCRVSPHASASQTARGGRRQGRGMQGMRPSRPQPPITPGVAAAALPRPADLPVLPVRAAAQGDHLRGAGEEAPGRPPRAVAPAVQPARGGSAALGPSPLPPRGLPALVSKRGGHRSRR